MARYSIYPCESTISGSTVAFRQLDDVRYAANRQADELVAGGNLDRDFVSIAMAKPVITLETRDLYSVLGSVTPASGVRFTNGLFYAQKRSDGATFASGSNHVKYTIAKGDFVLQTLEASQDDTDGAKLTVAAHALYDGTNAVVAQADSQALTTNSPLFTSRYWLGPAYFNGTQIPNILKTMVNFGINYVAKGFNGSAYPTESSTNGRMPTIEITVADFAVDAALSILSRGCADDGGSGLKVYFQKGAACSDRVAAGTAEHIRLLVTYYEWHTRDFQLRGNEDGSKTFVFLPRNAAISVSRTSTIVA